MMEKTQLLKSWKSKKSGYEYPIKWKLRLENLSREYFIEALIPNQELNIEFPFKIAYWEGKAKVSGTHTGQAYVEVVPNIQAKTSRNQQLNQVLYFYGQPGTNNEYNTSYHYNQYFKRLACKV